MSHPDWVDALAGRRSWVVPLAVFAAGMLVLFSKRPDALLNPQFCFEDGSRWYAQAHEMGGLRALVVPHRGYFVLVQRLGAWLAQTAPLLWAPLVMNLLAIAIEALPAAFIASRRFAQVVPRLWVRLLIAFLYLAMPGAWQTVANLTHTQWNLAILTCLVVLAAPPASTAGKAFDLGVTALSALSGPMAIFLSPVAALKWWARRERWTIALLGVTAAGAALQAVSLLVTAARPEDSPPLGVSAMSFVAIFACRVVYATLLGEAESMQLFANPSSFWLHPAMLVAVAALATALLAFAVWRAPLELRLLILFAALVYVPSLCVPPAQLFSATTYWDTLTAPGNSNRYFIIQIFTALVTLVWLASAGPISRRIAGAAALAVATAVGVRLDWREPPLRDYDFERYAAKYERAPPGERVQIVTPPGWSFVLTKR